MEGVLTDGEWADAVQQPLAGGGSVWLQHDGEAVWAAVEGVENGWAHLYLMHGDTVRVLHASAALGTAVYVRAGDHWKPIQGFTWEVRDRSLSAEAQAARAAFLAREGWVASTMGMGSPDVIEFKLAPAFVETADALAFVYASGPDALHHFPDPLTDATTLPALVRGETPDSLRFAVAQWQRVRLAAR